MEYTNHCIRATVITNLSNSGYEARHIIAVTGHRSETTVKQYATKCPDNKKRQISDTLGTYMQPKKSIKTEISAPKAPETMPNPSYEDEGFNTIDFENMDFKLHEMPEDPDDNLLSQILDDIEKENAAEAEKQKRDKQNHAETPPVKNNQVVNFNNISTNNVVQARRNPLVPPMYFPNSNVTINYNIINKN